MHEVNKSTFLLIDMKEMHARYSWLRIAALWRSQILCTLQSVENVPEASLELPSRPNAQNLAFLDCRSYLEETSAYPKVPASTLLFQGTVIQSVSKGMHCSSPLFMCSKIFEKKKCCQPDVLTSNLSTTVTHELCSAGDATICAC